MAQQKVQQPPIVPKEYAGQWIVWNPDRTKIVASGTSLEDAGAAAKNAGETDPGYEWIPAAEMRIVGAPT